MEDNITIEKLTYMLMEMPEGGIPTDDARLNYRVAKEYIKNAVGYYLKKKLFEDKNSDEGDYLGNEVTNTVEVKEDPEMLALYVDLLGESVDFGGSMKAYELYFKNLHNNWSCVFVPIKRSQVQVYKRMLPVPNVITYYKDGKRLVFIGGVKEGDKLELTQKNVIPSKDTDSLPREIGNQVLDMAYKTLYPELVVERDRNNDGVPN